ncbi:MAG: SMI1/KNR4 family protein [Chitinophagales bacterium]|nr:SMI1/KNR4 family protein [Chitinophagales bacterium]
MMNEQLKRILVKIDQLKGLDSYFTVFGSQEHKYQLNHPVSIDKVHEFERKYDIKLPREYVDFVTILGNGGAGPFYGLELFENCLFDDLNYKYENSLLNPSKPFLFTEPWNPRFSTKFSKDNAEENEIEYAKFEEIYYSKEHMNGTITICNYGCGASLHLIVYGKEYGNIWTDDRGSENGIYPSFELGNNQNISFLNWYELWLDNSLQKFLAPTGGSI